MSHALQAVLGEKKNPIWFVAFANGITTGHCKHRLAIE